MENIINPIFQFGATVYLKTDPEQLERICIGYNVRPTGIIYVIACGEKQGDYYDIELSLEKNVHMSLGIDINKKEL